MKQGLIRFILSSVCVSVLFVPATMNAFDIVKDGKPEAMIVVPAFGPEQVFEKKWTGKAAEWLREYVKKSSGAELKIVTEGEPVEGNIVSVGHTKMAEQAGIKTDDLRWDGCRLTVREKTLFLIGRDTFGPGKSDALGARGTCKAVAVFLEDIVGCRWFLPSPQGELVPEKKDISVPADLSKTVTPIFAYCTTYSWISKGNYGANTLAAIANNYRTAIIGGAANHTWATAVPFAKYGKEHPEYFALIDGKRLGDYLCPSNPEIKELLVQNIRAQFEAGYEWASLGQTDGYRRCECPQCEALDNYRKAGTDDPDNPCERILLLNKAVTDECRKTHPDKKINMLVYGPTLWPSRKFETFGDNAIADVCGKHEKTLPLWNPKVFGCTVWVYDWGVYTAMGIGPKATPGRMAERLRLYRDNKVIGLFIDACALDWGLEGPVFYATGRLLANPDLNHAVCVKEYCDFVYGKAGTLMNQFFDMLSTYVRRFEVMQSNSVGSFNSEDAYCLVFTPSAIQRLDNLLKTAEKQADSERSKNWVKLTRDSFDYARINAEMFQLYRAFQISRNIQNLNQLKTAVEKWKAFRQKLLDYGKDKVFVETWYPGWDTVNKFITSGGFMHSIIREPVTLDFDALAKSLSQKSTGPARIVAARTPTPPKIDGTLEEREWAAAAPQSFAGLAGVIITAQTKVRVLFDDKNLYVAFECEEPDVSAMKINGGKRDGDDVWSNDCIEFFLDPALERLKYFHFAAAPKEGCFYDARFGFVDDALDPLYGKEDKSWNPDWNYAFKIDAAGRKWTLEAVIPFASLGGVAPKAGTAWSANFARERQAGKDLELSLWSPNSFGTGFCEPMAFGELYFEKEAQK